MRKITHTIYLVDVEAEFIPLGSGVPELATLSMVLPIRKRDVEEAISEMLPYRAFRVITYEVKQNTKRGFLAEMRADDFLKYANKKSLSSKRGADK